MAKQRIKMGDTAQVIKEGDFYFGYIGKVSDRYMGDGQVLFCVRFDKGRSGWFKASELAQPPTTTGGG